MDYETQIGIFILFTAVVGLVLFITTVVIIRKKQSVDIVRRSNKIAVFSALAIGIVGVIHWWLLGNEPLLPFAPISIPLLYMAPSFMAVFYVCLIWLWFSSRNNRQPTNHV